MSTTSLTLNRLRKNGYLAEAVERWLPKINRRRDLFHVGDVLALHPIRQDRLIVQCTSIDHVGDRLAKIRHQVALPAILQSGMRVEVWGWARRGKRWAVRRVEVTGLDVAAVIEAPRRRRGKGTKQRGLFDAQS